MLLRIKAEQVNADPEIGSDDREDGSSREFSQVQVPVCQWTTQKRFDRPSFLFTHKGFQSYHERYSHREKSNHHQQEWNHSFADQSCSIFVHKIHRKPGCNNHQERKKHCESDHWKNDAPIPHLVTKFSRGHQPNLIKMVFHNCIPFSTRDMASR